MSSRFRRATRRLGREIGDGLWSAAASPLHGVIEAVAFALAALLLAQSLVFEPPSIEVFVRFGLTLLAVLLPFSVALRVASLALGAADPRRSWLDQVAVGAMSLVLWAVAAERLLGASLLERFSTSRVSIAVTLAAVGIGALVVASHRIALEGTRRSWPGARAREVALRELPQRLGPILVAPAIAAHEPAVAWLAVLGLGVQAASTLRAAQNWARKRGSFSNSSRMSGIP